MKTTASTPPVWPTAGVAGLGFRAVAAALVIALATLVLWQSGLLFNAGAEEVAIVEDSGDTRLVQVAAADTRVWTPPGNGSAVDAAVGPRAGQIAPNFEVSDFDGRRIQLADFRGQPVLLNFWASWCGPCAAEMPAMQQVLDKYEDAGLVVFALNSGERFAPAFYFVKGMDVRFTQYGLDPGEDVSRLYRVHGIPTSFFIDANGVVTAVHLGQMSLEDIEHYVLEAFGTHQAHR